MLYAILVSIMAIAAYEGFHQLLKKRHRCRFGKWGDVEQIKTSTNFQSTCLWVQRRTCEECSKIETRTIKEITS